MNKGKHISYKRFYYYKIVSHMSYHVCLNRHGDVQNPDLTNTELLYDLLIFLHIVCKDELLKNDGVYN